MAWHLMLAMTPTGYGEAVLGMRLARELRDRGHEVRFLAPQALRPIADDAAIRFGAFDEFAGSLERVLASTVREQDVASVVLVDAASVFQGFDVLRLDASVFARIDAPVLALDIWNLDEGGLVWDYAAGPITMDPRVASIRRLVPVPFARPTARRAYNALPAPIALDRRAIRAELGLDEHTPVVFWPTARWQSPAYQLTPAGRALATSVPELLASYVAALGPDVHVIHVGPERMRAAAGIDARYHWIPQVPAARFHALLAASDVMLGANLAATTLPSAIAYDVPAVVVINSHRTGVAISTATGARARAYLEGSPQLFPFRVCPAGLHAALEPVIAQNPFADALEIVELLDEERVVATLRSLLFDPAAAGSARARRHAYRAQVEKLPSGAERFEAVLAGRA